jgi:hypothetical protein
VSRRAGPAAAVLIVVVAAGCGLVGGNPRPDDPSAVRPDPPPGAATMSALNWQDITFEQPATVSQDQWDQPKAVAAGPGGFVAVGSDYASGKSGRIWRSTDATAWRLVQSPVLDGLDLVSVAATGDAFVAIGTGGRDDNHFGTAVLRSTDGLTWTQVKQVPEAWAKRVSASPKGFVAIVEAGDTTDLLVSSDGISWSRTPGANIADGAWISDVEWDGSGWIAAGSVGDRALVLRSVDGITWTEERLPAAEPTGGIAIVLAYRVVPGRWATLILGLDEEPSCREDDDFCPKHQAAWSHTVQTGWQRLPSSTWILGRGHGVDVHPAGDAGFIHLLADDARVSADGWDWKAVSAKGSSAAFQAGVVVVQNDLIGVGTTLFGDTTGAWFGHATISR